MQPPKKPRRRRAASIATLLGGAIVALLVQCTGLNPSQNAKPPAPVAREPAGAPDNRMPAEKAGSSAAAPVDAYYQLALTITPAFCELNAEKALCQMGNGKASTLTLHGLWPERLIANKAPSYCKGPALDVAAAFDERLARWMPGPVSGLPQHQWKKHGSCSGLKPMRYFSESINWAERVEQAIVPLLNTDTAQASANFKARLSSAWPAKNGEPALGDAISLHCKRIKTPSGSNPQARQAAPHLLEIRVCLSSASDYAPRQLLECAALDRIDQGCGKHFWIDS